MLSLKNPMNCFSTSLSLLLLALTLGGCVVTGPGALTDSDVEEALVSKPQHFSELLRELAARTDPPVDERRTGFVANNPAEVREWLQTDKWNLSDDDFHWVVPGASWDDVHAIRGFGTTPAIQTWTSRGTEWGFALDKDDKILNWFFLKP